MLFKPNKLAVLITTALFSYPALSSIVRDDISYQIFRDFAENKGRFLPGATNIPINTLNGTRLGVLNQAPMIDFSSADRYGVSTLVAAQYLAGVKHNGGYQNVTFGGSGNNPDYLRQNYQLVDRNNHWGKDLHIPRLQKYVTDVAPAEITGAGMDRNVYTNRQRFPIFYRMGSGSQQVRDKNGKNRWISGAYNFVTGGTVRAPVFSDHSFYNENGDLYDPQNDILAMQSQPGDSGSPLFGWDSSLNQWVLVGVMHGIAGTTSNWWVVVDKPFAEARYQDDRDPHIENTADLVWRRKSPGKHDNKSELKQIDGKHWMVHLADSNTTLSANQSLNSGKNVTLRGSGSIVLQDDINQGAGGLTFQGNYTVTPENQQIWRGAGLIVEKDKRVTWQVNGIANDFLHKIGEGTLLVNAKGKNPGSLSVGDGTVILQQQADQNGAVQAFEKIQIVSGRPTVVLSDSRQVQADNIYFGFRGGRLDLNGNDITFSRIRNVDNGARITNSHSDKTANIVVKGGGDPTIYRWLATKSGTPGTLYEYTNIYNRNMVEYFKLTAKNYGFFPTDQSNGNGWEYLGTDKNAAIEHILQGANRAVFLGVLGENESSRYNGKLNFTYRSPIETGIYTLAGGSNLNGEIKVEKGTLLLSGRPTPHAGNVTIADDWISTQFKAKTFKSAAGATLQLGNYADLQGNIAADANSQVSLGYSKANDGWNNSWQCSLNDGNGHVSCRQNPLSAEHYAVLPTARINGNITLGENAKLNIGKAQLRGTIQAAPTSHTLLQHDANWVLSDSSRLGNLTAVAGSVVQLNGDTDHDRFHTLTIDGNLNGQGLFKFSANLATGKSDRLIVNGLATGDYWLSLDLSGQKNAVARPGFLPLLTLTNANQDWNAINIALPNRYLDIGAYRYILTRKNNSFALYNALLPATAVSADNDSANPDVANFSQTSDKATPAIPSAYDDSPENPDNAASKPTRYRRAAKILNSADGNMSAGALFQPSWISRAANTALSNYAAGVNQLTKQQSQLNQYLQRLNEKNSGLWLNLDRETMRYSSDSYRTYKQQLATQQLGVDTAKAFDGGYWLAGIAFTHSRANNSFAENQNGNGVSHSLSWYNKMVFDNRFYLSAVLNYHYLTSKPGKNKMKQHAASASVALGQRRQLGSIGITPSADVTYYHLGATSYRHEDIALHNNALNFWQLRGGIRLDKTVALSSSSELTLYTAVNYVRNSHNHQTLTADGRAFKLALFKHRMESELGAIFGLGKHFNIILKGGYNHGDVIRSQFNGGVELKYVW
ncbi:S6 family peptidase [Testudinibacter sp. P80/BLE/0925]|uniref:S6 family peptidase n=1 Tax=Testudinibacter sp. TW-1 TaxID=3417757 RepID=UPI003D3652B8